MNVKAVEFHSELDCRAVADDEWRLLSPFRAKVFHSDGTEEWLIAHEGFVWDGASVPRIPGAYMLFGGRARRSALLHDWLYRIGRSRDFADAVFLAAMKAEHESLFTRAFMWTGVRMFGWLFYRGKSAASAAK